MSRAVSAPQPLTDLITVVLCPDVADPPEWLASGAVYHDNAVFDWVRAHPSWRLVATADAAGLPGPPTGLTELRAFELRHADSPSADA